MPSLDQLQRITLKLFFQEAGAIDARACVPVFHGWIQTRALDDLLIDVADYAHVGGGPAVVLVAHEGRYAIDSTGGRWGLEYARTQPLEGSLPARLAAIGRTLVRAARLLRDDPALGGRFTCRADELQIVANDRLVAPNTDETLAALSPTAGEFLTTLFGPNGYVLTRERDPRQRLTLSARAREAASLDTLWQRLS